MATLNFLFAILTGRLSIAHADASVLYRTLHSNQRVLRHPYRHDYSHRLSFASATGKDSAIQGHSDCHDTQPLQDLFGVKAAQP